MNDNLGEFTDAEAKRRAERIAAIRRSVREASEKPEEVVAELLQDAPAAEEIPAADELPAENTASDWENEIAARIAKRVQQVKQNRVSGAESILRELDEQRNAPELPDESPLADVQEVQKPFKYPSHAAEDYADIPAEADMAETAEMPQETVPAEEDIKPSPKSRKKKKKKKKTFKQRLLGFFPQRGDSVFECIRKVVFLTAIVVIIVCGYIVGDYYLDLWRSKRENKKVMSNYWNDMKEEPSTHSATEEPDNRKVYTLLKGAEYLLDQNSDVVGVIRIEGTPIDNPVMQSDDNSKYLKRKLSGRESRAGELFLDYRNHFDEVDSEGHLAVENSDNLVIYGHNMGDDQMFGCLKYYQRNDSYYGDHPVIQLNSNYEQYQYKIFAFFILDAEDETDTAFDCWNDLDFDDEEEFYDFVNEAKRRTIRLNDVDVKYGDKLLTLSTCNTLLGDRGRLIVLARLVRNGEDPDEGTQNSTANPNIKWPSVYYDYKGTRVTYDPDAEFKPYGPADNSQEK